jgi:serine/threonine protein kinase
MEHCGGGDLFNYIEKRGFKLPEPRAAELIHKLCTAIFYLHQYGIAHRDLKPENVLMTDDSDIAEIRLVDFGLSKIVGPSELSTEPFGTLVIYFNKVICCARSIIREAI